MKEVPLRMQGFQKLQKLILIVSDPLERAISELAAKKETWETNSSYLKNKLFASMVATVNKSYPPIFLSVAMYDVHMKRRLKYFRMAGTDTHCQW